MTTEICEYTVIRCGDSKLFTVSVFEKGPKPSFLLISLNTLKSYPASERFKLSFISLDALKRKLIKNFTFLKIFPSFVNTMPPRTFIVDNKTLPLKHN